MSQEARHLEIIFFLDIKNRIQSTEDSRLTNKSTKPSYPKDWLHYTTSQHVFFAVSHHFSNFIPSPIFLFSNLHNYEESTVTELTQAVTQQLEMIF